MVSIDKMSNHDLPVVVCFETETGTPKFNLLEGRFAKESMLSNGYKKSSTS